ncbi:response regulator [Oxalobacteraceae bacterium]|nr:response regulator [Oxalobacteraceae bacterium]
MNELSTSCDSVETLTPPLFDWSSTSLGAPDSWPASLRLTVDILLNSPMAMLLMWGPERIMVFNQAYADLSGGKNLRAPGAKVPSMQPSAWSWNSTAIAQAWAGHSARYRNQPISVWRGDAPAQLELDLFYTPVRTEQGTVGGILCSLVPAAAHSAPAAVQPLRILVVEDNLDAQYLVCETLRALGHEVEPAGSAEEAVQALQLHAFNVLFTDVSLPGMSGVELAREALRRRPDMHILFASGYSDTLTKHLEFPAISLQKPYEIEQLQLALTDIGARLQGGRH